MGSAYNCGACHTIMDYFHVEGIIALLLHCPVDAIHVRLSIHKEELLAAVESRAWELISAGMEVFCVDGAAMAVGAETFWTGSVPVNHNERGDFVLVGVV